MRKTYLFVLAAAATAGAVALACGSDDESQFKEGGADAGDGGSNIPPSFGQDDAAPFEASTDPGQITATIRDFKFFDDAGNGTNPDYENPPSVAQNSKDGWDDRGIVADTLGEDGKPVYAHDGDVTLTTHGKAAFDQWYRDVDGTNLKVDWPLILTPRTGGGSQYDSNVTGVDYGGAEEGKGFFPIDDGSPYATAFGNQGQNHNFSFSVEIHTQFTYVGGEFLDFRGDDDVWVYIDKKLVIDLGGIHSPEEKSVNVDDLGLAKGTTYPLDFFWAERHVSGSNVLFTTSIELQAVPR